MTVKGLPAKGTIFAIGAGDAETQAYDGETFIPVGRTTGIPTPDVSRNGIDVTALEDDWESNIPGILRGGTINVAVNRIFGNAGQKAMMDALMDAVLKWYRITFSDGTVKYGTCWVLGESGDATVDDKVGGSFAVKIETAAEVPAA
ncbi:MAG: phage tail tube protein [Blastomonas sp.]